MRDSMGTFNVTYNNSFDVNLVPNTNYSFDVDYFAILPPSHIPPSKYLCVCIVVCCYVNTCIHLCALVLNSRDRHEKWQPSFLYFKANFKISFT